MKTNLRISFLLLAFAGMSIITQAQITVTSADVSTFDAVGKVMTTHVDSTSIMVDIGSPGQTSWDFSALHSDTVFSMTSVVPSTSPFYSTNFPTSNVVFNFGEVIEGSSAMVWQHYTQNSNEYLLNGMGFTIAVEGASMTMTDINIPAAVSMKFPLTFNSQWSNNYTSTSTMLLDGFPALTTVSTNTETVVVDAWGSLKLPGGAVVQALRVRSDQRSVSSGMKDRTISYLFITKSGPAVTVSVLDTTAANSGMIQTDGISWSDMTGGNVGIDVAKPAQQFVLSQNRPNPVTQDTRIQYSLGSKQFVTLKVYNLLGVEVATLVNESKPAGDYEVNFDASQLAPGNYYYQLRAGSFSDTKKLIVIRHR